MCGVFGFMAHRDGPVNLKVVRRMAANTMNRGPHAFGFAWVDSRDRLRCFKQTGRIVDHLGLLAMAADAKILIGHCRFATHGTPANNLNNHPHPCDGGWIVHNGVIGAYEEIVARRDLRPVTECDSEVLGLIIEQEDGNLLERCVKATLESGRTPLVMLGLWARPHRLVIVRRGNPLSVGKTKVGTYFASLPDALPGQVSQFADGSAEELF